MTADSLVLLTPCCPPADDLEVRRLLELLAAATGAEGVELDLCAEGGDRARRFSVGTAGTEAVELALRVPGLDVATLRMALPASTETRLATLVAFALDKVLTCYRLRQQAVLLRGALDTTSSAVLLFDRAGDIVYANPPADRLLSRQTEDALVVAQDGVKPTPLFTLLCSLVEGVAAGGTTCASWLGTLALSDGSVLACQLRQVKGGSGDSSSGVLATLETVTALPDRCRGALAASYDFSPREEQVVQLVQAGLSATAIADRLKISPYTVRDHLRRLYRKTGTTSRRELLGLLQSATLAPPLVAESDASRAARTHGAAQATRPRRG